MKPEHMKSMADALSRRRDNPLIPEGRDIPVPLGDGVTWWISREQYDRLRFRRKPLLRRYSKSA